MHREKLNASVLQDLADRSLWDTRQRMFYEMRHHGLRRKTKPWPTASDVHFPLSDSIIEKLKPHYFQQLFATDLVASFIPNSPQVAELTTAAAQWFDHRLKQKSNLETEILTVIDSTLVSGTGLMKVIWNHHKGCLDYYAVDPQHLIVPPNTRSLETADRITQVSTYTVEAYKRNKTLDQDPEVLEQIIGSYDEEAGDLTTREIKYQREGLTFDSKGRIIVWEVYYRCEESGEWRICTYSPTQPDLDLRPVMKIPYNHGKPPFVAFPYEIKDAGYYSSRGVVEQVAVFEAQLCKLLNEKNDAMTLFNQPLYRTSREIPNAGNIRMSPGQILPYDIQPVAQQSPPISFDQQMNLMREIAQQRISTPDFGLNQTLAFPERRTATEVEAVSSLYQQSTDLRMRIFRIALGKLYRMSWSLLQQYDSTDLNYWYLDTAQEVPQEALGQNYTIQPTGSADGVNKQFLFNKAMNRLQMFNNDPFINQSQLRKSVLEADDATLVKRLFQDPDIQASDQAEQQAEEIGILRLGFPAQVKPADDDLVHIQTVMQYIQQRAAEGAAPEPIEGQMLQQHLAAHVTQLKEKDPKAGREIERDLNEFFEQAAQAANEATNTDMENAQGVQQEQRIPAAAGVE